MQILDSVTCSADYTEAATIEGVQQSNGGYFSVSDAAVYVQLQYGPRGQLVWTREVPVQPGNGVLMPGTTGVRFRNAGTLLQVATVDAALSERSEPALALQSGGQVPNVTVAPGTTTGNILVWNGLIWTPAGGVFVSPTLDQLFLGTALDTYFTRVGVAQTQSQSLWLTGDLQVDGVLSGNAVEYQSYVPAWTSASNPQPAIADSTVTAKYVHIGDFVHAQVTIVFGAGATFGTGAWSFSLPVAGTLAGISSLGVARMYDSNTGNTGDASCEVASATTIQVYYGATYLGANTAASAAAPWTWAAGDILSFNVLYEAP